MVALGTLNATAIERTYDPRRAWPAQVEAVGHGHDLDAMTGVTLPRARMCRGCPHSANAGDRLRADFGCVR